MTDLGLYERARISRPWIFVSGPMGKEPYLGPRRAMQFAAQLWHVGWHPFIPHLCSIWEMVQGELESGNLDGVGGWLDYDFSAMSRCDAQTRLPGASSGSDRETALAQATRKLILTPEEALRGPQEFLVWNDELGGEWRLVRR